MNYGKQELKAVRVNVEGRVDCPVRGCAHSVPRQERHFRRASEFRCPEHGIYISPSTFEYDDPLNNLLWRDADDVRLLETLKGVKRESRMARERSEDAVTWNVIRGLERAEALESWLQSLGGLKVDRATVAYWSCDPATGRTLPLLEAARRAFGEESNRGTEPDVIVVSAATLFFVEAKFTSGNHTQPSSANRAERYTTGGQGWYGQVMRADFEPVAVQARFYELLRLWLLGTWAAQQYGLAFCLVNLVGEGRDVLVEGVFGDFIRATTERRFKRATWEGALRHLQQRRPSHVVASRLAQYMREKTAGYNHDGQLRSGFTM